MRAGTGSEKLKPAWGGYRGRFYRGGNGATRPVAIHSLETIRENFEGTVMKSDREDNKDSDGEGMIKIYSKLRGRMAMVPRRAVTAPWMP